jgi:hypothetical protein
MKKAFILIFLPAVLILGTRVGLSLEYDDIQVLKSDGEGIIFQYRPSDFREQEKVIDNQIFQKVGIHKCPLTQIPGEPQLPTRIVILGIPLGCQVKVSILDSDYYDLDGFSIAPAPEIKESENPLENRVLYKRNENVYQKEGFFPDENVVLENPRFIRDQRIVRLKIAPLQFNPARNILRRFRSITIQIDFVGGTKSYQRGIESQTFENIFKNILLNYEPSKNWRRTRSRVLKMLKEKPKEGKSPFGFSDQWYKIVIKEDGIYKIGENELKDTGIDVESIDPREIRIFNGGGKELLLDPAAIQPELKELSIYVQGEEDGSFDSEDYILFYGWGVNNWEYDTTRHEYIHYLNHYTTQNIYWLTLSGTFPDSAKRMQSKDGSLTEPQPFVPLKFRSRIHLEEENKLYKDNGHYDDFFHWYWEQINSTTKYLSLRGIVPNDTAEVKTRAAYSYPTITVNDSIATVIETSRWVTRAHTTALGSGLNKIQFDFTENCYYDWYQVEYWREFSASDNQLYFESPDTSGVIEYRISGIEREVLLFDISDRHEVKRVVDFFRVQDSLRFQDEIVLNEKLRYYLVSEDKFKLPEDIFFDQKSYLRDETRADNHADLLIITHPDFYDHLYSFKDFREKFNQIDVKIVSVEEIYDEFSWGLCDPLAIREFLEFAHRYWQPPSPSFCLLIGDGNYDFKNNLYPQAFNWIPPFTADPSVSDENYAYFDRYGYLDSTSEEGVNMIIGRWPVKTIQQLEAILDKVMKYEKSLNFGTWRKLITLVADDEYNNGGGSESFHTTDTEILAKDHIPSSFDLRKIYLMEYPFDQLKNKPEAEKDLVQAYNSGSLVINWMGHGNRHQWAHEEVFRRTEDIPQLKNKDKLPLVYTASCSIGLFFEPLGEAMSEDLLTAENGGAVAVISATYLVYPEPNADLNYKVFDLLFSDNSFTLGEAFYIAKLLRQLEWGPSSNDRQYILMGDPLTRIGVPCLAAKITEISSDTLSALSRVTCEGEVLDRQGNPRDFDGVANILAFDSEKKKSHQMPNQQLVHYDLPGAVIFRGNVKVESGRFACTFVVPKDISYGGNTAKISIYIHNDSTDGAGVLDSLVVFGSDTTVVDTTGPLISISFSSQGDSQDEDWVVPDGIMTIEISDSNGINLTRELGHKITLVVDQDFQHTIDLTDLFEYYQDDYQRGVIFYQLPHLSEGEHSLQIKAWDNFNNSTLKEVKINIISLEKSKITDVMNYPNPFSDSTYICYTISGRVEKIKIQIFTLSGNLIKDIKPEFTGSGFNSTVWNGKDQDGDKVANGIYIYKIITDGEKRETQAYGKAVVMR